MAEDFTHNHYVPEWHQKRFISSDRPANDLLYLKLKPEIHLDSHNQPHEGKSLYKWGPKKCFAQDDLYTARFGNYESRDIERLFFGKIDARGRKAVDYFEHFSHQAIDHKASQDMLLYMSTQKLRTPKGLDWLATQTKASNQQETLQHMTAYRSLYSAIWSECIWQIADASKSNTKFILSDHPITVYNRQCGPRNQAWCRGSNDPDIRLHGSHTVFPLSLNKVLIMTNLSWARDPYQSAVKYRPNPNYFRRSVFNFTSIQIDRHLSEQEVREINFIIKSRAYSYVAASNEDWLYPEKYISKSNWNVFGDGYLLMPDPRSIAFAGEYIFGYKNKPSIAFDEFGRQPGDPEYSSEETRNFDKFQRFQGEFARKFGPRRRGRSFDHGDLGSEEDDEDYHKYHLSLEKKKS